MHETAREQLKREFVFDLRVLSLFSDQINKNK